MESRNTNLEANLRKLNMVCNERGTPVSQTTETDLKIKISQVEGKLNNLEEKVDTFLAELRSDMKDIKANTAMISTIMIDQNYYKESLKRSFDRIEKLENFQKEVDAYHNKIEGAKSFAWGLWAVLTSGVALSLFKIFFS
jgi:multidrug resistance efflux pump